MTILNTRKFPHSQSLTVSICLCLALCLTGTGAGLAHAAGPFFKSARPARRVNPLQNLQPQPTGQTTELQKSAAGPNTSPASTPTQVRAAKPVSDPGRTAPAEPQMPTLPSVITPSLKAPGLPDGIGVSKPVDQGSSSIPAPISGAPVETKKPLVPVPDPISGPAAAPVDSKAGMAPVQPVSPLPQSLPSTSGRLSPNPAPVPAGTPVETWKPTFVAPRTHTTMSPTGGDVALITVSRPFLNRLISTPQHLEGPVQDFVLGAQVIGEQTTDTALSMLLIPNPDAARFDLNLTGVTMTRTTARTRQAAIESAGRQRFDVRKLVEFDGRRFQTRTPGTVLDACQQNLQARTNASNIPVVGSIADTIALNQANRRRPLAVQESARRVTERVSPPFNEAIDQRLATANEALTAWESATPRLSGYLLSARWSTTENELQCRLPGYAVVADSPPPVHGAACLRLHESFYDSLATTLQMGGREVPLSELRSWISRFDRDVGGPSSIPSSPLDEVVPDIVLVLAESQPLTARFNNQEFWIVLRAALRQPGGVQLPVHKIEIGYSVVREGNRFALKPLPVAVTSEGADNLVSGAVEDLIEQRIQSRLEPVTISPTVIPAMPNGHQPVITDIVLQNGWFLLALD